MQVVKCANGHFYDSDRYTICPHCGSVQDEEIVGKKVEDDINTPTLNPAVTAEPEVTNEDVANNNENTLEVCNNCHASIQDGDKFCRVCGTKVGEGVYEPSQDIIQCIYGPMPPEHTYSVFEPNEDITPVENHSNGVTAVRCPKCSQVTEKVKFCSYCGHNLLEYTDLECVEYEYDIFETMWCCACGEGNQMTSRYCKNCGQRAAFYKEDVVEEDVKQISPASLTFVNTGVTVTIKECEFDIGQDPACAIVFGSEHKTVESIHATVFVEENEWYIKDNNTFNGTWLNGKRLLPEQKYKLSPNDEIAVAVAERIIFQKTPEVSD